MALRLGDAFSFDQALPASRPDALIASEARTRVTILGAGLAGLTCAYRLGEARDRPLHRDDVVVLEREAHPGGRVRSLEVDNVAVNLGAVTFQPEHYHSYMRLLAELGLEERVRVIPRSGMIFGYRDRSTRADTIALARDTLKGALGQGVFSAAESMQLLRFLLYFRRVTRPEAEAEFGALHHLSVVEWARSWGISDSLWRKFVEPCTRYCFRNPEDVSAAFGLYLLGFNFSRPATLEGGLGQVTDALAARLKTVLELDATVLEVEREPAGFAIVYAKGGALHRLHATYLVMAVPATVAGQLLPEMRERARNVEYGDGQGTVVSGTLKPEAAADLHLRVVDRRGGSLIYGGELRAGRGGASYANLLTYHGTGLQSEAAGLFADKRMQVLHEYRISPASSAPRPGQQPLPMVWDDGLYMAGDCVGLFPSQETAVSSGENVAKLLKGKLNGD